MDDTNRKMLVLIAANPRIPIRELAEKLGISRQAAHHRMRVLAETEVIKGTTAGISSPYLDAISVGVFGRSNATLTEEVFDRLGESEFTRRADIAGGNFLYVVGELREITELDGYVEFVKRAAKMSDPTVGIYCLDEELMPNYSVDGGGRRKKSDRKLSPLDLRIIESLKDDARKPIADVAKEIGASAKTVKRHLDDMVSEGLLDLHVLTDSASGGDMLFALHVNLEEGYDKLEVGKRLLSRYGSLDSYIRTFSNLPGFLIVVIWSDTVPEIQRVFKETCEAEGVLAVTLNFCYLERIYRTWRDKLPAVSASSSKTARTRGPRPKISTQ
jgi:DNA-binding Lrp family transcriptional regulator